MCKDWVRSWGGGCGAWGGATPRCQAPAGTPYLRVSSLLVSVAVRVLDAALRSRRSASLGSSRLCSAQHSALRLSPPERHSQTHTHAHTRSQTDSGALNGATQSVVVSHPPIHRATYSRTHVLTRTRSITSVRPFSEPRPRWRVPLRSARLVFVFNFSFSFFFFFEPSKIKFSAGRAPPLPRHPPSLCPSIPPSLAPSLPNPAGILDELSESCEQVREES